jgi:capsular exopolysaccharide synthesis family protein
MERIIQPYGAHAPGQPARGGPAIPHLVAHVHAPKSAADFTRALRRRAWVVASVALAVGLAGSALVLRMPPVFQATAVIEIRPPQFDPAVSVMIGSAAPISRDNNELYILDQIAQIQSKGVADEVSRTLGPAAGDDPLSEVNAGLKTQRVGGTNRFVVFLEGRDRERVARLLNAFLEALRDRARDQNSRDVDDTKRQAEESIRKMNEELAALDGEIKAILDAAPELSLDGTNRAEDAAESLQAMLAQKRDRLDVLNYEKRLSEMWPDLKSGQEPESRFQGRIDQLLTQRQQFFQQLQEMKRLFRNEAQLNRDPAARTVAKRIAWIDEQIARFQAQPIRPIRRAPDLAQMHIYKAGEEIRKLEDQLDDHMQRLQAVKPKHQNLIALMKRREQREAEIQKTEGEINKYAILAARQQDLIRIEQKASEPVSPVRPNRPMLIGVGVFVGLLLGVALVCLMESMDHSVKVPEQLTAGLALPLFGVVPRMRRLSKFQRGGHLWAPGVPDSLEADSFRNLRASLLGAERPDQPIVTLLVTSAKTGEGKSTCALNLAATCARAGERTILVDCDLRRPSLAEVFEADGSLGLADVLQGAMPWQRAVVRTEIPNLNFLPAGDTTGVPIEVLGSLELRQLIAALAGHYHRVILDGPAVLGLADCRMLGQVVDATVLVVRSGVHEIRPLRRAKEMLEQSRVHIAGVVFNGLSEDLDNWSSDGPGALDGPAGDGPGGRGGASRGRGLDAPPEEAVAGRAGGA